MKVTSSKDYCKINKKIMKSGLTRLKTKSGLWKSIDDMWKASKKI